jgi:hypothetical protein
MFIEDIAQENVKLLNVPDIYLLVIIKKNFKLIDYFGPNRDGISIVMTNEKYRIEIQEWSVRIFTNSLFKKEIFYNFDYFKDETNYNIVRKTISYIEELK